MRNPGYARLAVLLLTATFTGCSESSSADEVEGIYIQEETKAGLQFSVRVVQTPHLFLKNGEVLTKIDIPIEDLDIEAWKREHPDRWGPWRPGDEDGIIYVELQGGDDKMRINRNPAVPAGQDERLEGVWSAQSTGYGVGDFYTVNEEDLIFFPDGRFAGGSFSGAAGGGMVGHSEKPAKILGSYRLTGYTAEFTFNDGRTERLLSYFYDEDREWLVLGGKPYQRQAISLDGMAILEGQADTTGSHAESRETAAVSTSAGDGIPITPGLWRLDSFAPEGDLSDSKEYCLTKTAFDPIEILEQESMGRCEAGPAGDRRAAWRL